MSRPSLLDRLRAVRLLVLDVDGVLTDGRITYTDDGVQVKSFHVRDGSGLKLWHRSGGATAIITGRTSNAVTIRAAELGIANVHQGASVKRLAWDAILERTGFAPEQVATIGDDLPDLPLLARAGVAFAVADACEEVREAADIVTTQPGGGGAVRAMIERLLHAQGRWAGLIEDLHG